VDAVIEERGYYILLFCDRQKKGFIMGEVVHAFTDPACCRKPVCVTKCRLQRNAVIGGGLGSGEVVLPVELCGGLTGGCGGHAYATCKLQVVQPSVTDSLVSIYWPLVGTSDHAACPTCLCSGENVHRFYMLALV